MATIYDVARTAGVSPKTVSRVLNGGGPVSASARGAVREAMNALGYVPSHAARSIKLRRSGLVGLITGAISQSGDEERPSGLPELIIVQGAQAALAESGLTLLIADTGGRAERAPELSRTFRSHRVEAIIWTSERHQRVEPPPGAASPIVLANCYDDGGAPAFVPDDRAAQRDLARALLRAGHRRIGFATLPEGSDAAQLRLQGHCEALAEAGVAFDADLVSALADDAVEHAQIAALLDRFATMGEPPTVICCGNDRIAMTLYGVARSRGIAIPDELSVAGFDDHKPITENLFPELTSVELPYRAIGAAAARCALAWVRGEPPSSTEPVRIAAPLRWRRSVRSLN